jgi:choline kinase
MKAIILAAGAGTRLRPLTATTPKCLLSVDGTPILRRLLDHLRSVGVDEAVIVTGYRGAQIDEAVAAWALPMTVTTVANAAFDRSNNAVSTLLARSRVDGHPFLLLDADVVCDREVVAAVVDSPRADCLAMRRAALGAEEMKLVLDAQGRVARCSKEVDPACAVGESIGINRFSAAASRRFFEILADRVARRGLVDEYNDAAVEEMIAGDGHALWPIDVTAWYATEIDTADDLAAAERVLSARRRACA